MKLSVFVVTYNQEQYIRQCLDSIVMQKTNFEFEVIVGEDCSKDKTPDICDEYAAKYPFGHVFHHKHNIGLLKNWEFVMNRCSGEYIALIEGDDYWIDEHKLQKQVDWLDAHPDYSFTFTRAKIDYMDGALPAQEVNLPIIEGREYDVREVCSSFIVLSSSVVMRNCINPIRYSKRLLYADTYTFIRLLEKGRAYCLPEQTVAYRVHKKNLSYNGDTKFYVAAFSQERYFMRIFPQVRDIYAKRKESDLNHLIYDKQAPAWKYRLYKIVHQPSLLFSRFMLKTIKSYILPF